MQVIVDLYDSTVEFLTDEDGSLFDEWKKCKNNLFYLADQYAKCNKLKKRLQGNEVTIIQAQTILIGYQNKIGIFKSSLAHINFSYFSNLRQLKD